MHSVAFQRDRSVAFDVVEPCGNALALVHRCVVVELEEQAREVTVPTLPAFPKICADRLLERSNVVCLIKWVGGGTFAQRTRTTCRVGSNNGLLT
jgi:hypothetical protein